MTVNLIAGIVRILDSANQAVGAGFVLTTDGLIATCSHVVESAGARPGDIVRLIFHLTNDEATAIIEPKGWRAPEAEDIAILRLDGTLPQGVMPLPLGRSDGTTNHPFETFGFPDANPIGGLVGGGQILGQTILNSVRVIQLRSQEVTGGFSGAPVWDCATRRVVGMVTATSDPDGRWRLTETAFMTPSELLRQVCPILRLSDFCPYRGLAAFTEANAEFFFGREALTADLLKHLQDNPRFLAVIGPSGSGKSSVVQAGLIPALYRDKIPGSTTWYILSFRPGNDPFAALANTELTLSPEEDFQVAVGNFLKSHLGLKRLILFCDQFEELFVLCTESLQTRFMIDLLSLLNSDLPVTVILA